jgi:hypothetical protein
MLYYESFGKMVMAFKIDGVALQECNISNAKLPLSGWERAT